MPDMKAVPLLPLAEAVADHGPWSAIRHFAMALGDRPFSFYVEYCIAKEGGMGVTSHHSPFKGIETVAAIAPDGGNACISQPPSLS